MEAMRLGGIGMWLTLVCGFALVGAGLRYAVSPEKRYVPLLVGLGVMTLASGAMGFTTGLIASCAAIGQVAENERFVTIIGLGESLYNVAFALLFVFVAAAAASVGAIRVSRAETTAPAPA
jgi:hypothetical protein